MSAAPPETSSLFSLFNQIHAISDDELNAVLDLLSEDMEGLSTLLAEHRAAMDVMKLIDERIAAALIPVVPFGGQEVQGVGYVEIKGGSERKKFDQPRVVSSLAARISDEIVKVDPETGEIDTPPVGVIVELTAVSMAKATGAMAPSFSSWRTGELKAHGLDPDDFCEKDHSPKKVVIRKAS